MAGYKYVSFVVVAAVAALASARPHQPAVGGPLDLESVLNNTVCPIKMDYDYDRDRIPKRIKVLKCGTDPNEWCAAMGVPQAECCHHAGDNMRMQCVEVQDLVQVYYPKQNVTQQYRVSVGCACVMQQNDGVGSASPWS